MNTTKEYITNLQLLGEGVCGHVYKDKDKVYKLYRKQLRYPELYTSNNPSLSTSFFNKYKLNKLKSLNTKIKGSSLLTDYIYIDNKFSGVVSNYVEGETLQDKMQHLTFNEKIKISYSLLASLEELLYYNIYPEDVHLGNIIIDENLNTKIIDLDDYLTRTTPKRNRLYERKSYKRLKLTIKNLFQTNIPININTYPIIEDTYKNNDNGIRQYLNKIEEPITISFITINTDIGIIKELIDKKVPIIIVYDITTEKDTMDFINGIGNTNIKFNGLIPYDKKEVYSNNYNIDEVLDYSRVHVLCKK